jgi:hypothetical protein
MNRTRFADRHPIWFVALMEAGVILVYLLAGTIAHVLQLPNLALYGLANLALTIIAALLLTIMGWWRAVGMRPPARKSDLYYFIVPFLPMFINLIPGLEVSSPLLLAEIFATTLMVGFVEEMFFRGLMLNALKSHGFWKAALITALLFGLTHAMNVLAGKSFVEDAAQVFYAVAIGFAFAALVLKKGIIWPLILAHFLIDFANFLQKPGFSYPPSVSLLIVLGIAIVFSGYGVFVLLQKPAGNVHISNSPKVGIEQS